MTRLLQVAAGLTLLGLALMVWSMVQPTPMPVMLAMSVGQLVGTVAFGMFGYVVLVDQLRKQRAKGARARRAAAEAPGASGIPGQPAAPPPAGSPDDPPASSGGEAAR
jgi:hypothetical protein